LLKFWNEFSYLPPAIAWNILQEKKIKIKLLEHEILVLEISIIIIL
jgi:hypothetical protein